MTPPPPVEASPAARATLTFNGAPADQVLHFRGDLATLDSMAKATDSATGALLRRTIPGDLGSYSGSSSGSGPGSDGGTTTWESFLGGSTTGVVFVQTFFTK